MLTRLHWLISHSRLKSSPKSFKHLPYKQKVLNLPLTVFVINCKHLWLRIRLLHGESWVFNQKHISTNLCMSKTESFFLPKCVSALIKTQFITLHASRSFSTECDWWNSTSQKLFLWIFHGNFTGEIEAAAHWFMIYWTFFSRSLEYL